MNSVVRFLFFPVCVLLFCGAVASQYDAKTGFTRLIGFGGKTLAPRPPSIAEANIHIQKGTGGYDAQFYVNIAVDPLLNDPRAAEYHDRASYRVRRVGMPWAAWALGFGNPERILQAYSLLNVFTWLFLAFYLRSWLGGLTSLETSARWFACMFAVGTLDSVRQSLTDLPSTAFVLFALFAFERKENIKGFFNTVIAIFTKETSLLVLAGRPLPELSVRSLGRYVFISALAVLPFALWLYYTHLKIPIQSGVENNFSYPLTAMFDFCVIKWQRISAGNGNVHDYFGFTAVVSGVLQVVLCLIHFRWKNAWCRVALPFALIFIFSGEAVWSSTMAPLRIILPLTFLLFLMMPKGRFFYLSLFLMTLPTGHGIIRWIYNL